MSYRSGEGRRMRGQGRVTLMAAVAAMLIGNVGSPVRSEPLPVDPVDLYVQMQLDPVAMIELDPGLLRVEVPPPGSTVPASGLGFKVIGNASATLTATPSAFIDIPFQSEGYMGMALRGSEEIGYKIELRFPRTGVAGSPVQVAVLPGFEAGPTVPPLTVDLELTGGVREGVIHLEADHRWTDTGEFALTGLYLGQVTITMIAHD